MVATSTTKNLEEVARRTRDIWPQYRRVIRQSGIVVVCFFAILYSDSIGTTLSPAVRNDVDNLRQVWNDIAHISEAELTDTEFQNYMGRVLNAFTSLGLPINEIEDIKNQKSFPTVEVET